MRQNNSPGRRVNFIESLESRRMLAATATYLTVAPAKAGLGQVLDISIDVTCRTSGVRGTAEILDNGTVVGAGTLSKRGTISGSIDAVDNGNGGNVFADGTNVFTAQYMGRRHELSPSTSAADNVTISMPRLLKEAHGLHIRTVYTGSGAAAAAGQSVTIAYTGYLTNGTIFDSSVMENNEGNSPGTLTFTLTSNIYGATVVPGFDEGVLGMQVGETRIIDIPSALGYGSATHGSVPANSELIFVVTRTA